MTKLVFRYSWVYDKSIYFWLGEKWEDKNITEGLKYCQEIQKRWDKTNSKVFNTLESFGFKLPKIWQAYIVTCQKIINFSDPLTFKISYNWGKVYSTLIHELVHLEFGYSKNKVLKNKAFEYIKKSFPQETPQTRTHLAVNLLQVCVMAKVFPTKYQKMISPLISLPEIKRAWVIIKKTKKIDLEKPIKSILKLKP